MVTTVPAATAAALQTGERSDGPHGQLNHHGRPLIAVNNITIFGRPADYNRFQTAIEIQDACNPSGVARELVRIIVTALRLAAVAAGGKSMSVIISIIATLAFVVLAALVVIPIAALVRVLIGIGIGI